MLNDFVHRQTIVIELLFLLDVIIQSHSQVLPATIEYGVTTQHPLFLGDAIVAQFASVFEHTFEDTPMDGDDASSAKSECRFVDELRYVCRHAVCFFLIFIVLVVLCLGYIILLHQLASLVDGYFTFDVFTGCLFQILRNLQAIDGL